MAAIVAQMELETQGLLTVAQVQHDLQRLLGKQLISIDIDTKAGRTDYPILAANLLIETSMHDNIEEIEIIFTKLYQLYDQVDGLIRIICREYRGVAGRKSLYQDTGGQLFLD
jgi:hypothetical protein